MRAVGRRATGSREPRISSSVARQFSGFAGPDTLQCGSRMPELGPSSGICVGRVRVSLCYRPRKWLWPAKMTRLTRLRHQLLLARTDIGPLKYVQSGASSDARFQSWGSIHQKGHVMSKRENEAEQ